MYRRVALFDLMTVVDTVLPEGEKTLPTTDTEHGAGERVVREDVYVCYLWIEEKVAKEDAHALAAVQRADKRVVLLECWSRFQKKLGRRPASA